MLSKLNSQQRITLVVILILLIAIPLVLFLVRQQQNLKGRAAVDARLTFVTSAGNPLPNPPTTNSRDITLRIDHSGNNPLTPPPPGGNPPPPGGNPPPPSTGNATLTATNVTSTYGAPAVRVNWSGVGATDIYWFIKDNNSGSFLHLDSCSNTPAISQAAVTPSGFCIFFSVTPGQHTYSLHHYRTGQFDQVITTSNTVTL